MALLFVKADLLSQVEGLEARVRELQSSTAGVEDCGPSWGGGLQGDLVYKARWAAFDAD